MGWTRRLGHRSDAHREAGHDPRQDDPHAEAEADRGLLRVDSVSPNPPAERRRHDDSDGQVARAAIFVGTPLGVANELQSPPWSGSSPS
jgi:hypothetical protein